MPDLRIDPLSRRPVLLAPERAKRGAPPVPASSPDPEPCDFCGGHEGNTPPEVYSVRHDSSAPDTPGWVVRSVPNLYPATQVHEVVVHSPGHHDTFEGLEGQHRSDVMRAYRDRLAAIDVAAGVIVWNRGRASGASRSHEHGQIFGLEIVPPTLEREAETLAERPCLLCEMGAEEELQVDAIGNGDWLVVAHPVPFVADELLIIPPHGSGLGTLDDSQLGPAAEAFASAISRALTVLGDGLAYNLVVHSAPRSAGAFHWHAHLMPRTATWGGLEMGAELAIVASDPHETARRFREVTSSS